MSLNLLILKSNLGKWMERRAIGFQMPYFSLLILYLRMFFVYDSSSEWIYMESHLFQCSWPENPKSKLQDIMQPPKINYGVLSFHCLNWDRSGILLWLCFLLLLLVNSQVNETRFCNHPVPLGHLCPCYHYNKMAPNKDHWKWLSLLLLTERQWRSLWHGCCPWNQLQIMTVAFVRSRPPEPRSLSWWSVGQLWPESDVDPKASATLLCLWLWGGPAGSQRLVREKPLLPSWIFSIHSFNSSQPPFP